MPYNRREVESVLGPPPPSPDGMVRKVVRESMDRYLLSARARVSDGFGRRDMAEMKQHATLEIARAMANHMSRMIEPIEMLNPDMRPFGFKEVEGSLYVLNDKGLREFETAVIQRITAWLRDYNPT